jgi:hypothetical protein
MLFTSVVDRGFESRSGRSKDYKIGICCFSIKNAALRKKRKDWLTRNQNNVSHWGDMSIRELLYFSSDASNTISFSDGLSGDKRIKHLSYIDLYTL